MRLVLDSNVLIAAFAARGVCAELLEHGVREHELVTAAFILDETRRNLVEKVRVTVSHADQALRLLRTRSEIVDPDHVESRACTDPDDLPVLGTAVAGRCDAIITGDRDLLDVDPYRDIRIMSPRDFWRFESQELR